MSSDAARNPPSRGPLAFGLFAEILTVGLAVWFASEGVLFGKPIEVIPMALLFAPFTGGISIISAIVGARFAAVVFAWVTVACMMVFSALIFFAIHGLPILFLWLIYAIGEQLVAIRARA
jgi:hypothetical protein